MSERRRVWITGIGSITAIGTGRDAFRAGLRAGRSPVKRIDRFDPCPFRCQVAAQVDDFDPLAWMPPKTARQLDRFSQFGLVAGRLALDDAGLTPGAGGAADPQRIGIYLGSALGGIAYAEVQHEQYLETGIRQVAPNLALAVFGGAAPANLGIALDVRGPILSTANSCASGAVALGEALGDLREGRVDAAIAGGVEIPLSPLAFGAFDIIRALSAGHNDEPGAPRGRSTVAATGSSWARARRCSCSRRRTSPSARGADAVRRAAGLRRDLGRAPHGPATRRRLRGGPGGDDRARRRGRGRPTRSTTSTPTRRRRRSATWPRRGRSRWPSASGRRPSR